MRVTDPENTTHRFTRFETAVLNALLAEEQPLVPLEREFEGTAIGNVHETIRGALAVLRKQLEVVRIVDREFTGVGSFTSLEIPTSAIALPAARLVFGNVHIRTPTLHNGAGSIVFVTDGRLSTLETFTYGPDDEMWAMPETFTLSYPSWRQTAEGMWISDLAP